MTFNKSTFCAAPWFQLRLDWDGRYKPCCEFSTQTEFNGKTDYYLTDTSVNEWMMSEYSTYLREKLSTGQKISECSKCWHKESLGIQSLRQMINDTITANNGNDIENTWVRLFVEKNKNFKNYLLKSADIKLSNVCNFACAMCSPESSSKILDQWERDPSANFIQITLNDNADYFNNIRQTYQSQRGYQHLKDILQQPITHLKLLGGEPLLDKELFKILSKVSDEKRKSIHLHFVTNGSQSLTQVADILHSYKSISFTVSLEGIGSTQDYIRLGSVWGNVEKNILEAKQQNLQINIHHTLQALSVINVHELIQWAASHDLILKISKLENPKFLSVGILPRDLIDLSIENLLKLKDLKLADGSTSISSLIDLVKSMPDMTNLYQEFLDFLNWYERRSNKKIEDICTMYKKERNV